MPGPEVTILGTGAWGAANAMVLAEKGVPVRLWGRRPEHVEEMARDRTIPHLLPGVRLHDTIRITADPAEALDGAALVAVAIPTQHIRETLGGIARHVPEGAAAISLAKGIEVDTLLRPTEIIAAVVPHARPASLSGPSHAEEVARGIPTSVVVAAVDEALASEIQHAWNGPRFRVYRNTDLLGVEMGGAIKNIIAVAAGVCDGLGFGDNSKAALLTRGLAELVRFGVACGGRRETFYGLSGMGDLVVTGVSQHSRNWSLGCAIGEGRTLEEVLRSTEKVAEGVWTTKAVHALARRLDVPMPITAEVHEILFGGKAPKDAVRDLMTRDLRSEEEPLD